MPKEKLTGVLKKTQDKKGYIMKKRFFAFVLVITVLAALIPNTFAENEIKVYVNGELQSYDQMPVMINDRVLVPMRAIFESLGAKVFWDDDNFKAEAVKDFTRVSIGIGKKYATVNSQSVALDSPAVLVNDRTLVPVRFVSESLGASVNWNNDENAVEITYEELYRNKIDFEDSKEYKANVDYVYGGGMNGKTTIESGEDHTGNIGRYMKIEGFQTKSHRFKLANIFPKEYSSNRYSVSFWVRSPDIPTYLIVGAYSPTGTAYATRPTVSSEYEISDGWTNVIFDYESTDEIATMLGFYQNSFENSPVLYIDDIEVVCMKSAQYSPDSYENVDARSIEALKNCKTVIEYNFDDWTTVPNGKFASGANYQMSGLSLSDEYDLGEGGKSLKFGQRELINHRIKIADAFSEENIGKKYVISMWLYIPDISSTITVSTLSMVGTRYAFTPVDSKTVFVKEGEWTQVAFIVEHKEPLITMVGIEQASKNKLAENIYIDNVKIGIIE